ncbi:hypothetical protein BDZ97DRAFT_1911683 [Flammula alnicola]|nr:hypothetical protein BDZ97DRAFT_1911683 [Flammula alnicola]
MSTTTLTTAMHRSQQPRATRTPPPVSIPYHPRSHSQTAIVVPSSPPSSSQRPRRPSISNTMHWLSRTNSPPSTSSSYTPSKPIRISEPKRVRGIDVLSPPRSGTLGSGATIVRTPDEALRETGVRLTPEILDISRRSDSQASVDKKENLRISSNSSSSPSSESNSPPTPTSPPLPPLPLSDAEEETLAEPESPGPKSPPRPNRAPPPAPISQMQSRRSSMKVRAISTAEDTPTVPPLPPHIIASNQPPPFQAILVSEPPSMVMDASKVIVTIETCTETYKTTLSTIKSRPSHLSKFLSSVFHHADREKFVSSVYSAESDDLSTYRRHLTSQGLLPHSCNIHIFIDRASAPYAHILSYLRSPIVEGQPEVLPRALQLHASTSANIRLESLIEVRDEAAFLNLDGLHKLCTEEIRLRYGPRLHTRGQSSSGGSIHSLHASVYSLHTLAERGEASDPAHSIPTSPLPSTDTFPATNTTKSKQVVSSEPPARSPPTPQSWEGPLLEQRSHSRQSQNRQSLKSPPAGWI